MVDLGSLVILMSIFGAKVAVAYVVVGLIVAIAGGTLIERLHMERYVEDFIRNASQVSLDAPEITQRDRLIFAKDAHIQFNISINSIKSQYTDTSGCAIMMSC